MDDLISRHQAIDEANAWLLECLGVQKQDRSCGLIRRLEDLPSEPPERKKGKWVFEEYPDGYYHSECSECKHYFIEDAYLKPYNFCPNCGCRMEGDADE